MNKTTLIKKLIEHGDNFLVYEGLEEITGESYSIEDGIPQMVFEEEVKEAVNTMSDEQVEKMTLYMGFSPE